MIKSVISIALSIVIPLAIYFGLPPLLERLIHRPVHPSSLLATAAFLYLVSFYLPSINIAGEDTDFVKHFVGGGLFSGLLWLYIKQSLNWRAHPLLELVSLYFLVSGLGVANELFEFFLAETGIMYVPSWDTWWDLLANNLGALTFWFLYFLRKSQS